MIHRCTDVHFSVDSVMSSHLTIALITIQSQVYTISGGKLKIANRQYTSIKNNYEITFDRSTEIHPCEDETSIKNASYNFVKV